jgi:hypothetical protein
VRGEFGSVPTNVPGVRVCELLPLQAAAFDKLTILRSVVGMAEEHSDVQVMTAYPSAAARSGRRPSFGAVVSKVRGPVGGVPPFVSLRGMTVGTEPGFLGVAHRPFTPSGPAQADLRLPADVIADRLDDRRRLAGFDTARRDADPSGASAGMDAFQQRAFEMVTSGRP